ncbi:MAG TPA: hypothetical protein PLR32_00080 [candidate division Zixibacteria bacterium]|nr:hypothetical protein [candidate division Zixibacteria bacterium]
MAKRNGSTGETAGGRLDTLRAQIGALLARKRELGAATGQPDSDDPLAWAARAGQAGAEIAAIDQALPMLEAEARAAEAQIRAAHDAEQAAAAERMRGEIPERLGVVVGAVDALDVALDALLKHEQAIRALGGWVPQTYTAGLRQAVNGFRGDMRRAYPELVGLPPKRSQHAALLADARAELERREAGLETARHMDEGPRGEVAGDKKRLIERMEYAVDQARRRVGDLEAGPAQTSQRRQPEPRPDDRPAGVQHGRASYWEE